MMFKEKLALNPLFIIAVLFLVLTRNTEAAHCTANQISSLNVAGCDCQKSGVPAKCPLLSPQCGSPPSTNIRISPYNGGLNLWGQGCLDDNFACDGCYLWFGSLCYCLKSPGSCTLTTPVVPGNPIWVLLEKHDLITTTQKLPGILELHLAPEPNRGWQLGQDTLNNPPTGAPYTRTTGALAMNSLATRTEEQIHIHVCNNQNSKLRTLLSKQTRTDYATLTPVTLDATFPAGSSMWCQVAKSANTNIDVAASIFAYLGKIPDYAASCEKFDVGAGLINDSHGYSWACVTTGTRGAEDLFCRH